MVVENRKLLSLDLAKLAREAENARERLERLNRDNKTLYEKLEPVVGSFCPALAKRRCTSTVTPPGAESGSDPN